MDAEPLDVNTVTALVTDATAAPSLHNAQPWAFRYLRDTGVLHLYADPERTLPRTDPESRGLHIGCGAALLNLRVAAAAAGLAPVVRLLPDPARAEFLAEVHLCGTGPPDDALARLAPSIQRRHSSRLPFRDKEIPAVTRGALDEAARAEGAQLRFPDIWHVQAILASVRDAEDREALDPGVREETVRWTRTEPSAADGAADGIPAEAFGPRQHGSSAPVRDFAVGRPVPGRGWAHFERNPNIALLGTARDEAGGLAARRSGTGAGPAPGHHGRAGQLGDVPAPGVVGDPVGRPRPDLGHGSRPDGDPARLRPRGPGEPTAAGGRSARRPLTRAHRTERGNRMKVSEVMTAPPVCVAPHVPLDEVTDRMAEYSVGSVLVVEDGALHGIVTDRDLAVRGLGGGLDATARVDAVMSPRVITVEATDDLQVAYRTFRRTGVRHFRSSNQAGSWAC